MSRVLVEHFHDGRARYVLHADEDPPLPGFCRPIAVLRKHLPQLHGSPWAIGEPACLECGWPWVALMPNGGRDGGLECLSCGKPGGRLPNRVWCGACGADGLAVLPPDAPRDGVECHSCGGRTMTAEA